MNPLLGLAILYRRWRLRVVRRRVVRRAVRPPAADMECVVRLDRAEMDRLIEMLDEEAGHDQR